MRMDEYLERWAEKYKPISHIPNAGSKEKAFYRIDSITSLKPFVENLANAKSPALAYVTQIDDTLGGQSNKFSFRPHRVFILVKREGKNLQNGFSEELADTDAKLFGAEIGYDLKAYILDDKKTNKDLAGITFEHSSIFTLPTMFNGWWPTEFVFNEQIGHNLCVNPEKYND